MERLHALLRAKVHREHLTSADFARAGMTTDGKSKKCWLCGCEARLRYRLKDTSSLCFPCFRTAYIALVLPFIDTAQRRASDAAMLKSIEAMAAERRAASVDHSCVLGSRGDSSVFDPSQASFVMSASRMRQRLQSNSGVEDSAKAAGQPQGPPSPPSSPQRRLYWNCPRCTYVNPLRAKRCEACDFANSTTVQCPHCRHPCPVDHEAAKAQRSVCSDGQPHVPWCCGECGQVNTLDGDTCEHCRKERYWACTYCTALHNVGRAKDGLRYCATCGSYNTPEDIQRGQETIDAEHKKANRMAACQQDAGAEVEGVVFGVNDAQTLAEQQRQKEIEENTARLNRRLDKLQIRRISQKSDGNCLFSALAHQLFGNHQLHYLVRSCVVAYMRENPADYVILFDGEGEWSQYVNQMKENGTWGDELCINAAARCFCVNIHVITSDPERWHMVFQQDELGKSETNLRDKLPAAPSESDIRSPLRSPPQGATHANGKAAGGGAATTLCLFLAYLYPVHFDDVTPSDVPAVVLSDLMIPVLRQMLTNETGTSSSSSTAKTAGPTATTTTTTTTATTASATSSSGRLPAPSATAARGANPSTTSKGTPPPAYDLELRNNALYIKVPSGEAGSVLALHSEQHQERKGSAVSTSPTVECPVVPRARGPGNVPHASGAAGASTSLDGSNRWQMPPPPHLPSASRSSKGSHDSFKGQ